MEEFMKVNAWLINTGLGNKDFIMFSRLMLTVTTLTTDVRVRMCFIKYTIFPTLFTLI